jgi:long-subunit fatty acid transport protein
VRLVSKLVSRCSILSTAIVAALTATASAQTTTQFPIQFDFLNPGARSLALGSAFIGLADDASAAFTNPSGLLQLTIPEVSIEGRFRRLDTRFLERGRISGTPQNIGEDTINGPIYAEDRDSAFGPSFVSFTYPARRWALGVYRHELTRVDNEFLYRGVFERSTFLGITDDRNRDLPLEGQRAIRIDNYGTSFAYRVSDRINAGAGVGIYHFDLDASFRRLGLDGFYGPPTSQGSGSTAIQEGNSTGVGFNVGLQAQIRPRWNVGIVYKKAPDFDFTQVDNIPFRPTRNRTGKFQVPDTFGIGTSWRVTDALVIAADYVRVGHEALKRDFVDIQSITTGREEQLAIDDANEWHFGVEWVVTRLSWTPALRAGAWFDPDHSVRYVPTGAGDSTDTRFQFILPGGEDLWHYTFGIGFPLSTRLEVNAAADLTERSRYASASMILRLR